MNDAPQVRLTSPASGSAVNVGSLVTVAAVASDADGINKVDFYVRNHAYRQRHDCGRIDVYR